MKDVIKSVRMTEEQEKQIMDHAKRHHLSFSDYVLISALRGEGVFDPVKSVHTQNILNIARILAKQYAPKYLKEIDEEENAIWYM